MTNTDWVFKMADGHDHVVRRDLDFNPYSWHEVGHNSTHVFWVRSSRSGCNGAYYIDVKVLNTLTQGTSVRTYTIEEADRLYLGHE